MWTDISEKFPMPYSAGSNDVKPNVVCRSDPVCNPEHKILAQAEVTNMQTVAKSHTQACISFDFL